MNNIKRILTGIIGFPVIVAILIFANTYIIDVLFSIVALISIYEYFKVANSKNRVVKFLGYIVAILIAFIHIIPVNYLLIMAQILIPTLITILFIKVIVTNMETNFNDITITLFGILYIVGFLVFMPLLYSQPNGKILIWYVFISAWGTDTFAYFVGKSLGKHKLTKVSPKKSVEGSIGGTVGAILVSLLYTFIIKQYFDFNMSYIFIGVVTAILSILSQIGDLSASTIKRFFDVKDFGNLIPGHGGMLDRIDSIILIAPFAYFLLVII